MFLANCVELSLPVAEPEELELLLLEVVELTAAPRVTSGETGEPRSSSLKSGLFLVRLSESANRLLTESKLSSCMGFLECDIFQRKGGFVSISQQTN